MGNGLVTHIFGYSTDVDVVAGSEDVIGEGGLQYWAESAGQLSVSSSSANDTVGGTGTWDVHIEGLDSEYRRVWEEVALNGLTPVTTKYPYLRVNSVFIHKAGVLATNAGVITLSDGAGVQASIQVGRGESNKAAYTVPVSDINARIVYMLATLPEKQSHSAIATLKIRYAGDGWRDTFTGGFATGSPLIVHANGRGIRLPPTMDIRLNVFDADADSLKVTAGLFIAID